MTTRKRPRRPKLLRDSDVGLQPWVRTGDGYTSFDRIYLTLTYKAALSGGLKEAAVLLRIIKKREQEQLWLLRMFGAPLRARLNGPKFFDANAAIRLLRLGGLHGDGDLGRMGLKFVVVEAALSRLAQPWPRANWRRHLLPCDAKIIPYRLEEDPRFGPPTRKPEPKDTRFQKGVCPNPNGRPRKPENQSPYDDFFNEIVTVSMDGQRLKLTRSQHLLWQLSVQAALGDKPLQMLLQRYFFDQKFAGYRKWITTGVIIRDGGRCQWHDDFSRCLYELKIVNRRNKTHALLLPWVVEWALDQFDGRRPTVPEQEVIMKCTSTPEKVHWPRWWEIPVERKRSAYLALPGARDMLRLTDSSTGG